MTHCFQATVRRRSLPTAGRDTRLALMVVRKYRNIRFKATLAVRPVSPTAGFVPGILRMNRGLRRRVRPSGMVALRTLRDLSPMSRLRVEQGLQPDVLNVNADFQGREEAQPKRAVRRVHRRGRKFVNLPVAERAQECSIVRVLAPQVSPFLPLFHLFILLFQPVDDAKVQAVLDNLQVRFEHTVDEEGQKVLILRLRVVEDHVMDRFNEENRRLVSFSFPPSLTNLLSFQEAERARLPREPTPPAREEEIQVAAADDAEVRQHPVEVAEVRQPAPGAADADEALAEVPGPDPLLREMQELALRLPLPDGDAAVEDEEQPQVVPAEAVQAAQEMEIDEGPADEVADQAAMDVEPVPEAPLHVADPVADPVVPLPVVAVDPQHQAPQQLRAASPVQAAFFPEAQLRAMLETLTKGRRYALRGELVAFVETMAQQHGVDNPVAMPAPVRNTLDLTVVSDVRE